MKVAYIVNQLQNKAPIRVLYNIYANNLDIEPVIICLRNSGDIDEVKLHLSSGAEIISLDKSFIELELKPKSISKEIYNTLKSKNINIVHSHTYQGDIISSYLPDDIKKISTQHNIAKEDYIRSKGYFIGSWMLYRLRARLKYFDNIVSISNCQKKYYQNEFNLKNISTIYNGIDIDSFIRNDKLRSDFRKKYNIREDAKVFVVIGSIIKIKNPFCTLDAFNQLFDSIYMENLQVKLFFIGGGELLEEAKHLYADNENIVFTGFQDNIISYLSMADTLISASFSEGMPLNILEGLASSLDLILSDIPVHREIVDSISYNNTIFFNPNHSSELFRAIIESLNFEKKKNNFIKIKELFDRKEMSNNYKKLYFD